MAAALAAAESLLGWRECESADQTVVDLPHT